MCHLFRRKTVRFQAHIRKIHRYRGPRDLRSKLSDSFAANYRVFIKLSPSPKHPHALSELALAAVANGRWQLGHLFNPSPKASRGDWLCLFVSVFFFLYLLMELEGSATQTCHGCCRQPNCAPKLQCQIQLIGFGVPELKGGGSKIFTWSSRLCAQSGSSENTCSSYRLPFCSVLRAELFLQAWRVIQLQSLEKNRLCALY